jgi:hypothetical protein
MKAPNFWEQAVLAAGIACFLLGLLFLAGSAYWNRKARYRYDYEDCMKTAPWYVKLCEWVMGR